MAEASPLANLTPSKPLSSNTSSTPSALEITTIHSQAAPFSHSVPKASGATPTSSAVLNATQAPTGFTALEGTKFPAAETPSSAPISFAFQKLESESSDTIATTAVSNSTFTPTIGSVNGLGSSIPSLSVQYPVANVLQPSFNTTPVNPPTTTSTFPTASNLFKTDSSFSSLPNPALSLLQASPVATPQRSSLNESKWIFFFFEKL